MAPAKFDLYQSVTDHIISTIENLSENDHLIMPWHRSGLSQLPTNVESSNHYNGVNILSLWVSAIDRGFTSNIWGTYRWSNCSPRTPRPPGSCPKLTRTNKISLLVFVILVLVFRNWA